MRKVLTLILTVVLVLSLAVPAFAASPTAPIQSPRKTTVLPVIVGEECDDGCMFVSIYQAHLLGERDREIFLTSQKYLKDATPEGMVVKYFFYHVKGAQVTTELCEHTFDIGKFEQVVVKQFEDGKWVETDVTVNSDKTITVDELITGPVSIFIE